MKDLLLDRDLHSAVLLVIIWVCAGSVLMALMGREYGAALWVMLSFLGLVWKVFWDE